MNQCENNVKVKSLEIFERRFVQVRTDLVFDLYFLLHNKNLPIAPHLIVQPNEMFHVSFFNFYS